MRAQCLALVTECGQGTDAGLGRLGHLLKYASPCHSVREDTNDFRSGMSPEDKKRYQPCQSYLL